MCSIGSSSLFSAQRAAEQLYYSKHWPEEPAEVLRRRGFTISERSLSVGWARVLSRVDLREKRVYLDGEAIASYAAENGLSAEAVRRRALAHELGHVLLEHLSGAEAEAAAERFAQLYCGY